MLSAAEPFIIPIANWSRDGAQSAAEPLRTVTAWPRGGSFAVTAPILAGVGGRAGQSEPRPGDAPLYTITAKSDTALVAPILVQAAHGERRPGDVRGADLHSPIGTIHAGGGSYAIATAFLAQQNGGFNATPARDARQPLSTITNTGSQQQLVTAHLAHLHGNCDARNAVEPLRTISAGGQHHALVECTLSPELEAGAMRVAAFLMRYHSSGGQWAELSDPLTTITTKDRLALVTVTIAGTPYVIVDIGLRMLTPRELYRAQGFPDEYVIDRGHDGRRFTKAEQVHMCGNSVSPLPMAAIAAANDPWRESLEVAA